MDRDRPLDRVTAPRRSLKALRYGLLSIPLLFLVLFYFYPLGTILELTLIPEDALDLSGFTAIFTSSYYLDILWFTLWQAVLSTLLTLGLALPGAYVFVRFRFPGKALLLAFATLPFVLPTVVVAVAFRALIGADGVVNQALEVLFNLEQAPIQLERTVALILLAHVFYNYAIALRIISGYWANQTTRIEDAARVLGAADWQLWLYIRLPLLRPAILAAAVLVFIFTFTSFGVVLTLGGFEYATLEVAIYREWRDFANFPTAAALSLVQIMIMLVMMVVYTRLQRSTPIQLEGDVARTPRNWRERLLVAGNVGLMALLLFTPLIALVLRALLVDGELTGRNFTTVLTSEDEFRNPVSAIRNSVQFAVVTTLLAVVLGLITSYLLGGRLRGRAAVLAQWLDPLFMLPLATSAVTLGFGLFVAMDFTGLRNVFDALLPVTLIGDWDLRDSVVLVPIAHTLVAMPFVVRSVLPSLRGIPPTIQEAAVVLGASPWQVWRYIDLPLISRGVLVGATFAFTISMGEFGASLFLAREGSITMPRVIFYLLGRPGAVNYGQALALSVLLMAVCAISFILVERLRKAGVGEF